MFSPSRSVLARPHGYAAEGGGAHCLGAPEAHEAQALAVAGGEARWLKAGDTLP